MSKVSDDLKEIKEDIVDRAGTIKIDIEEKIRGNNYNNKEEEDDDDDE